MRYIVRPSSLSGSITVPPSKSHSLRAIMLASLARGQSRLSRILPSPDAQAMIVACKALGGKIEIKENNDYLNLCIEGTGAKLQVPEDIIDVGNSGQVLRFISALSATIPAYSIFTGDISIRSRRPMQPLLDALKQLGAFAVSSRNNGYAPIIIKGPVKSGRVIMDGEDSQPVSAMLFLTSFLPDTSEIIVRNPGEKPWIDLTLYWLDRFGISYKNCDYKQYTVQGREYIDGFDYAVPGDFSSAAFPLTAAVLTNSCISLNNMDMRDPQGDKILVDFLKQMGANIIVEEKKDLISTDRHDGLHGIVVDINAAIDALPILATAACFADSPTHISGAEIARRKESDRIAAISRELGKMGANIEEREDGLIIYPAKLHGALLDSHADHRIAMSLAVAAFVAGKSEIAGAECVKKSFPDFARCMAKIGADICEIE